MARHTTSSPGPWPQYEVRTSFLRVPWRDWPAVKAGRKSEIRATGRAMTQLWNVKVPTPVVGYSLGGTPSRHESVLLVLEETWCEPLGAISEESLRREGFPDLAHFRRHWMAGTKRRFRPLLTVRAYRFHIYTPDEAPELGTKLIERLYGIHLPS